MNAPVAPGLGDVALLAGRPLTARIAAAPEPAPPQDAEPVAQAPAPVSGPAPREGAAPPRGAAPASAAGLPSAEIYFRGSEVDERAVPLNHVDVAYPEQALAARINGVVTLRLLIDHQGVLREATVTGSTPAGTFDNAALEAVRALRFRPAVRNGVPVGSVKVIEVPFDPDCNRTGSCNN